jgi:hypothetical protein
MRRIPNLETAIAECKRLKKTFTYGNGGKHIKFYVDGKVIIISRNNDNPDKVRKEIRGV